MADKIQIVVAPVPNGYEVRASLVERTVLPEAIFQFENTGESTLGQFLGVVSAADLYRRQVWTGVAIPTMGNRFVVAETVTVLMKTLETANAMATNILAGAKALKNGLNQRPLSSEIYEL